MAVVLTMASASAHHPSLRPRRPSSASWTSPVSVTAAGPATSLADRRGYQMPTRITAQYHHHHHPRQQDMQSMHSSRGRSASRAGSASSTTSRSPSSRSSQLSDSPRIRVNGHSHRDHIVATGEEGMMLVSVGGHGAVGSGTMTSIGGQRMRRPRRRADEVERLYKCIWNGCEKSYGTLSHLNDHVRLQRHGTKREPHEFKEARRIWRQERKSRRLREHAIQGPNSSSSSLHRHHHLQQQRQHQLLSTSAPVSRVGNSTNSGNLPESYRPNYARPDLFGAEESSPEDAELDGDFDREHTPLTPPGLNTNGPRIAAATSSYHTYSRPPSSQNPTISSLPSYSSRAFINDHLDSQNDPFIHEQHQILSPMQSTQAHPSPGENQDGPKNGFRLPSIAELRLDLTLDEYEAHSALGSLSGAPVARPSSATASVDQHLSRGSRNRRRESWESPSTSPNASLPGHLSPAKFQSRPHSLAPPPPYHLYPNGHDSATNSMHSPDFTNQYRFRITSAASSPSMERPPSRSLDSHPQSQHQHQQHQQGGGVANSYSRPRAMSHSRHPSSSRPSTSTTTSTSQSYHLSTPAHPASNFPFIPAQPPRLTPEASEGEPRRKRRKYEEIERRYQCGWNGCTKAYGTLNHLNDHVSLQGHGAKRRGSEFS